MYIPMHSVWEEDIPKINAPFDELSNVRLLTALTARVPSTSLDAGTPVEAELQPLGVDLVGNSLDSVGPLLRVGHELSAAITVHGRPTVIDVDVLFIMMLGQPVERG
jgi:hypothetical protein